jgi:hypothetical protein
VAEDLAGAIARVSGFLEAWNRLKAGGQHTELIYSAGAFPDEDDPRELRQEDIEALLGAAGYLLASVGPIGDEPTTPTPVEDDRVSDAATGLPPLERVTREDTILLAAYSASVGVALSPVTRQPIPVRYLSVRGLINAPAGEDHAMEWGQIHVAVPVEHTLDVAAALAKGSTETIR